jgi:hypothetical protein
MLQVLNVTGLRSSFLDVGLGYLAKYFFVTKSASPYCGSGIQFFISMQIRDLDPVFHFKADPDLDQLLLKVMGICEHWFIDPLGLHFEPADLHCQRPRPSTLYFGPLKLLNFDFYADPDPDPAFKK